MYYLSHRLREGDSNLALVLNAVLSVFFFFFFFFFLFAVSSLKKLVALSYSSRVAASVG